MSVRLVFFSIYLASGFAALLYQVVWQRMLAIFSGADLYATTTIVASFMAGMGLGSLLGGSLADRLSARGQIAAFALAEFLIGVFALISKWWYYDVLYVANAALANSPVTLAAVLFGSLLIPTCAMGMTFPLLSKALTPAIELAGKRIGSLYAINTLGAAAGAFATAWFLMGDNDFPRILRFGARLNIAIAVLALILGFLLRKKLGVSAATEADGSGTHTTLEPAFRVSTWVWIYALSGFLALSLEIVWFRLLGVLLKSNSFTFPHLLAIYLVCLAIGIMAGSKFVHFGKRPEQTCLALQSGVVIYASLSIAGLLWSLDNLKATQWLQTYLAGYEPYDVIPARTAIRSMFSRPVEFLRSISGPKPNFLSLYIGVPLLMIAPPTLMMGASFPFLQRAVQNTRSRLGRRVGWLQASNIFGSTMGAVLVGSVFLHHFGTSWTLRLLIALGGMFMILRARLFLQPYARRIGYLATPAIALLLMSSIPSGSDLWPKLHGALPWNTISAEDGSGVSLLKSERADFASPTLVYVNGLGQSWVPYTVNPVHSLLGIIPVLMHPAPKDVAVIGLGSGDTAFSLGGREETTSVTCIEIVATQLDTLRSLHQRQAYGGLQSLLTDDRYRFAFTDGRTYLGNNPRTYDIIEADALRPNSAFAGNLYSHEYFTLLKNRLNPGGLAVTWAPTYRVIETFMKVFPYAYRFDSVLIGSAEPIPFDRDAIRARVADSFTRAYYAQAGIDVSALVLPYLDRKQEELEIKREWFPMYDVNSDMHPKDEYGR